MASETSTLPAIGPCDRNQPDTVDIKDNEAHFNCSLFNIRQKALDCINYQVAAAGFLFVSLTRVDETSYLPFLAIFDNDFIAPR